MTPEKRVIDWPAIALAYRANLKSLKAIGAEYGVSDAGILKRANRDGWERDLGARIRAKAEAKVSASVVSAEVSALTRVSENQVVEANATLQSNIIISHRTDIQRSRKLTMVLLEELEIATCNNGLLRQLAEMMAKPDKHGVDRLNDLYNKIIAMPNRVDSIKKLADTLKTLIGLEREAFGIDAKEDSGKNSIESVIRRVIDKRSETVLPYGED